MFTTTPIEAITSGDQDIQSDTELTTQQAAELMRVSHAALIKILAENQLPSHSVDMQQRVRYGDILAYIEKERSKRKGVLKELIAEQERLGLYG